MGRDEKRTGEEDKREAAKLQRPDEPDAGEPEMLEPTAPVVGESTSQAGDAMPDAVDQSDGSAAIDVGPETETAQFHDVEAAHEPVEAGPIDQPPIAAGAPAESANELVAVEPAFDGAPTAPIAEDKQDSRIGDVLAPTLPSANEQEASSIASLDSADVGAMGVNDPSRQPTSQTFFTPPPDNSFVFDAASFSLPSLGRIVGDSDHVPDASESFSSPRAKDAHVIDDLVHRPGDHGSMERLPYIPGREPDGQKFIYLGDAPISSSDQSTAALPSQSTPSEPVSPIATDDLESALTCPVVLVEVPDGQVRAMIEEELDAAAARDAKTLSEIAKDEVEDAFWVRACHERAVYRD
jgi:hypothetical protein